MWPLRRAGDLQSVTGKEVSVYSAAVFSTELPTKCTLCYSAPRVPLAMLRALLLPVNGVLYPLGVWCRVGNVEAVKDVLRGNLRWLLRTSIIREVVARCTSIQNWRKAAATAKGDTKRRFISKGPSGLTLAVRVRHILFLETQFLSEYSDPVVSAPTCQRVLEHVVCVVKLELHKLDLSRGARDSHFAAVTKLRFNDDEVLHKRIIGGGTPKAVPIVLIKEFCSAIFADPALITWFCRPLIHTSGSSGAHKW